MALDAEWTAGPQHATLLGALTIDCDLARGLLLAVLVRPWGDGLRRGTTSRVAQVNVTGLDGAYVDTQVGDALKAFGESDQPVEVPDDDPLGIAQQRASKPGRILPVAALMLLAVNISVMVQPRWSQSSRQASSCLATATVSPPLPMLCHV